MRGLMIQAWQTARLIGWRKVPPLSEFLDAIFGAKPKTQEEQDAEDMVKWTRWAKVHGYSVERHAGSQYIDG